MMTGLWPQNLHLCRASVLLACVVRQITNLSTIRPPPIKVLFLPRWWAGVAVAIQSDPFRFPMTCLQVEPSPWPWGGAILSNGLCWQVTDSGLTSIGPQRILTAPVLRDPPLTTHPPGCVLVSAGHHFLSSAGPSGHLIEVVVHFFSPFLLVGAGRRSTTPEETINRAGYLGGLHVRWDGGAVHVDAPSSCFYASGPRIIASPRKPLQAPLVIPEAGGSYLLSPPHQEDS